MTASFICDGPRGQAYINACSTLGRDTAIEEPF
jgi:hypothetical protein